MAEPTTGDCCYYLPELYEVKSLFRHQIYRIVGVTSKKIYVVQLMQLQPTNISVMELNELHAKFEEQQNVPILNGPNAKRHISKSSS